MLVMDVGDDFNFPNITVLDRLKLIGNYVFDSRKSKIDSVNLIFGSYLPRKTIIEARNYF